MAILTQIEVYNTIIGLGLIIVLLGLSQWNWFRQRAYALMLQGKRMAKCEILKSGEEQEQWVTDMLQAIPWLLPIPRNVKLVLVKYLYRVAKDLCDNSVIDNSV